MYKQYLKQVWNLIRQERLFSVVYIIGTGLSVSMVMVLSLVFYIKIANIYPETNRNRTLVAKSGMVTHKNGGRSSSSLSEKVIQTCLMPLEDVEAVAIISRYDSECLVQQENKPEQIPVSIKYVNRDFWTVFPFRFLQGQPFTEADQQSGIPTAVIARSLARRLYGETDPVGRYVSMNFKPYRICGVVEDASFVSETTYALLWIPYTASENYKGDANGGDSGLLGYYAAYMLVSPQASKEKVKATAIDNVRRYSQTMNDIEFSLLGQPDYHWQSIFRQWSNSEPDYNVLLLKYGFILLVLLLIPAVSLSGMTESRMERRLAEMGVRRAFGAPVGSLMKQIISENFIFTLLGGLFGLLFSYLLLFLTRNWIMQIGSSFVTLVPEGVDVVFSPSMLFNYQVFGITLLVCFLLNLLSALIPAWRASHRQIIYSLNAK